MIGYTIFGSNDLQKGADFYDKVFAPLGYKRCYDGGTFITFGAEGMGQFAISTPYDGKPATNGNGTMIAITAPDKAAVQKVYDAAIAAGGADEGAPGYRGDDDMKFYAGYFRDLDGNKLNVFCMGQ